MDKQLAPPTTDAIALYQRMPDPMTAIQQMGKMFASSGLFGCSKEEQGQVLALACMIEGKSPFELMKRYHIIGGNLAMKSVAMLADFVRLGGVVSWKSALNNVDEARADFQINGQELMDAAYTIDDAKREKLVGGSNPNWVTRPAEMLRARLVTKAIRMVAPGIIMGMEDDGGDVQPIPPGAPLLATPAQPEPAQPEPPEGCFEPAMPEKTDDLDLIRMGLMAENLSEADAVVFCIKAKLLEDGEALTDLTPAGRRKIMKNLGGFITKVKEAKMSEPKVDAEIIIILSPRERRLAAIHESQRQANEIAKKRNAKTARNRANADKHAKRR